LPKHNGGPEIQVGVKSAAHMALTDCWPWIVDDSSHLCVAVCCSVFAVCRSVLQCVAVCCRELLCVAETVCREVTTIHLICVLQCVAVRAAVCGRVLQRDAVCCGVF